MKPARSRADQVRRAASRPAFLAVVMALVTLSCGGGGGGGSSTVVIPPPPAQSSPPTISTGINLAEAAVGRSYSVTLQASGGTPPYTWSLVTGSSAPAGLSLSAAGVLSGTPTSGGQFGINVRVQDSANLSSTRFFTLPIYDVLTIISQSLPNGNVGIPYCFVACFPSVSGGKAPITWGLASTSAQLPPGITLSASGTIQGTPTGFGTFPVTLQATDSLSPPMVATRDFTILIKNDLIVVYPYGTPPTGVVNRQYRYNYQAVGGTPPYQWSLLNSIPPGLTMSTAGELSGTPQVAGFFTPTFTVADSSNPPQQINVFSQLFINSALQFNSAVLNDATIGFSYVLGSFVQGGLNPYTARLTAGTLPAGIQLSPSTFPASSVGLFGNPTTPGTSNFSIEVTDSSVPPYVVSQSFSLRVNTRLQMQTTSLPDGMEGQAYNFAMSATDGVPPYVWSDPFSQLPPGLAINASTGVISGTPTRGFRSLSVGLRVNDASFPPQGDQKFFPMQIFGILRVATTQLPTLKIGQPVKILLSATGGSGANSWSIATGQLPAGLNLSTAGEITGTPSVTESQSFTVQVRDANAAFPQSTQQQLVMTTTASPGRNDSIATATPISNGRYQASLSPPDTASSFSPDQDYYKITATAGAIVVVDIFAERLSPSSLLDSVIEFVDPNGSRLFGCEVYPGGPVGPACLNDDHTPIGSGNTTIDSRLGIQVPGTPGTTTTFYVRVLSWDGNARPEYRYEMVVSGAN